MGDRANVVIIQHPNGAGGIGPSPAAPQLFLYTHWGGSQLPATLQAALIRGRGRWGDEQYLARIIFSEMTRGQEMSEVGFGISTYIGDNEYELLVVDCEREIVQVGQLAWTFTEFVAMPDPIRRCWGS